MVEAEAAVADVGADVDAGVGVDVDAGVGAADVVVPVVGVFA